MSINININFANVSDVYLEDGIPHLDITLEESKKGEYL